MERPLATLRLNWNNFLNLFIPFRRQGVRTAVVLFLFPPVLYAGALEKGFEALKAFNYFNAKELFEKSMKRHPAGASYGLSDIFYREDNPFHHIDSAYKYILFSDKSFKASDAKEKQILLKLSINQPAIDERKEKIIERAFEKAKLKNTIESFTRFIENFTHPALKKEAVKLRGKLAFENAKKINTAQSYKDFIATYPDAEEIENAKWQYEFTLFNSMTKPNSIETYQAFIKQFPKSPYRWQAEDSIFAFSTRHETIEEYHEFIKKHGDNHHLKKAWDMLYSLSTIDFSPSTIENFLLLYPDFPDKQRVKTDIENARTSFFLIRQEGKWGYIDSIGQLRVPCLYDWADDFSEGATAVFRDGKAGYINKTGTIFLPLAYDEANSFHNGLAIVKQNRKFGLLHKTGKQILPFEFDDISYDENASREKIIRALKEGIYKFYNTKGEFLTQGKFEKAGDFSSGRAYIVQDGKYGFINTKGEIVISAFYDWAESFRNGTARVKQNNKFGLIDISGKPVIPCEYDRIDDFSEGLSLIAKEKKIGFADAQGNIIIPVKFDYSTEISAANGFQNGMAKVEQNKKRGLIDKTGKFITPCEYDDIRNFASIVIANREERSGKQSSNEELCAAKKSKWGYIDKNKKQKINFLFDYAWDFSGGLARVKTKGKIGFINQKGELVIPAIYEEATDFKNGISMVVLAGKKGIIDTTGKLLIPCEMDEIIEAGKGMMKIEKNEKIAYYNILLQKQIWAEIGF